MKMNIVDIRNMIERLTLEEKASLCSGEDFWTTKGIDRLAIPSILMTDGPHGLRKQEGEADHVGLNQSVPATCFPSASGMASSWNRELIQQVGKALGKESQSEGVSILLGPGANIKRSPLCGRNFEYFSEDPYLTGELATAHINGVQSQGVGTSLKHFAVNNQEHRRMTTDAVVDERTLREIYLTGFEIAVKKAQPWTVMSAYNKLNGTYCSENEYLLTNILKNEWGHEGIVVSDWGAVNEAEKSVAAGMELEMPSSYGAGKKRIIEAVQNGTLSEEVLDESVERLLKIVYKAASSQVKGMNYDREAHHLLAREVAAESMVLLKNEDKILPLKPGSHIAVIGDLAEHVRYQGGGSSHINPTKMDAPLQEIMKLAGDQSKVTFTRGYDVNIDVAEENELLQDGIEKAQAADVVVLFVGLPERYESEGYDREHLHIPPNQIELIDSIASVQQNIVVVLSNGSAIEMPWLNKVKGILEGYLGGQAVGGAIADLLFGVKNPSGKLAETFPEKLKDTPSYLYFPGEGDRVEYHEGIFTGYRYYDAKDVSPLFPFGYGLSYTSFEYSQLTIDHRQATDQDVIKVSVAVKNTGDQFGKEIVQLYVRDIDSSVTRPEKELKGFEKVALQPGEKKVVTFHLNKRSFAYYNTELANWHVETGEFEILVGKSSKDIVLKETLTIQSTEEIIPVFHRNTTLGELMKNPKTAPILQHLQSMMGESAEVGPTDSVSAEMMEAMMRYMPLRALIAFSKGKMSEDMLEQLIYQFNEAVKNKSINEDVTIGGQHNV
ncbi:glycoside hydrolase family 3 C-terminal domain-containing protein [Metabacillus litoralis]|nr:glycoside hydrolase family 3 C-terminal domain-containing protein [Metabacillus litoralis]MCM3160786.1 glycoside hydrolase family 3 C-terminal domain-containing protein [Metabacillus litoralis]